MCSVGPSPSGGLAAPCRAAFPGEAPADVSLPALFSLICERLAASSATTPPLGPNALRALAGGHPPANLDEALARCGALLFGEDDQKENGLRDVLRLLWEATRLADGLQLFSDNEELDDVATHSIRYLLLPFLVAVVCCEMPTLDRRRATLQTAQSCLDGFMRRMETLGALAAPTSATWAADKSLPPPAARELRIARVKKMRELEERISLLAQQVCQSLERASKSHAVSEESSEVLNEEEQREMLKLILQRCGEECFAMRDSIRRELPLLAMREERQAAASEATRRTGEGSEGGGAGRRPAAAVLQAGPHPLAVPGRGRPNGINSWMGDCWRDRPQVSRRPSGGCTYTSWNAPPRAALLLCVPAGRRRQPEGTLQSKRPAAAAKSSYYFARGMRGY
eukprot:GHVT01023958.1.p1 GENE.GHVT01023958.1~~GHVT01023958.1.p1  ORF type:complete len:396 (-),score=98.21 GHVT01023958.1:504-1691(-)